MDWLTLLIGLLLGLLLGWFAHGSLSVQQLYEKLADNSRHLTPGESVYMTLSIGKCCEDGDDGSDNPPPLVPDPEAALHYQEN